MHRAPAHGQQQWLFLSSTAAHDTKELLTGCTLHLGQLEVPVLGHSLYAATCPWQTILARLQLQQPPLQLRLKHEQN